MNKNPKISVLTPLYNTNPEYLKEMINSVLNQTFKDFEFILLNDSPDNNKIETIVKSYNDPRIKYFKNDKNMGISFSRNKLIDLAQGEYIAVFDHDDISLHSRLEKQADYLDKHPLTGVVSCNYKNIYSKRITNFPCENSEIKKELVIMGLVVVHSGAMIRKSVLTDNNIRYEEEFSPCEDYMLWAKLINKTCFHNIKEVLLLYRDSKDNTSNKQSEKMEDATERIRNFLYREYPYYNSLSSINSCIYLFGIPIIKKQSKGNRTKYLLFGKIPFLKEVK